MTSIAPRTRHGSAQLSMGNFAEASLSSPPQRKILPLGSVSPEMASKLIDELMRVIEEQAEVKLSSMGDTLETQRELDDAPSVYSQRSYYEVNEHSQQNAPPAVVYYSAPQSSIQHHSVQLGNHGPAPLNLSKTRESIHSTTSLSQFDSPANRRGSKFILVDQTQTHPLHRIGSQQSNIYEPKGVISQRYPARMDSIHQGEEHPPSSLTLRRHSTDANQSYMSLSDTASIHDSPQNSILNYKKWIGAGKTGSRVTSQKSAGPVVVEEKKVVKEKEEKKTAGKEKAPTVSKSKSFFSHFKYEMHPTPMYGYAPPPKKKPANPESRNKGSQRFSIDGSSSNATSIRRVESSTKSSTVSTNSKEKKHLPSGDGSKLPLHLSSRNPSMPQVSELPAKQSTGLISQLEWNNDRVPVNNKDFQHVEGWLSDTHAETASPAELLTPVFSENNFASTAPTSPDGSNRLSVVFEGGNSVIAKAQDKEHKLQSRIISVGDLNHFILSLLACLPARGSSF